MFLCLYSVYVFLNFTNIYNYTDLAQITVG